MRIRLLTASSLVLSAFVLITGIALQQANHTSALESQHERMQGLVYSLLGAIEVEAGGFTLNEYEVPEPRLSSPDSGLTARVVDRDGSVVWQSQTSLDAAAVTAAVFPGQWDFFVDEERRRFSLSFGFRWLADNTKQQFTIQVVDSMQAFLERQKAFRRNLWLWLLAPAALLLLIQLFILAWAMRPLQRLAREIRGVEAGEGDSISGDYPQELHPLQSALNTLLAQEQERQKRYRQALDDLAHSLKTPLTVISNLIASPANGVLQMSAKQEIAEQSERMQQIISRQLKRAAYRSRSLLAPPIDLNRPLRAVIRSLEKVYSGKALDYLVDSEEGTSVRINQSDLYEVLGNLLDNASKWARSRVAVKVTASGVDTVIRISDDGPGFPPDAAQFLKRGWRADLQQEGQGLGLAVTGKIVSAAGGQLEIDESVKSGGVVILQLPSG
jgi:two-component system, OmpR family, sensor histidine kinase PhoQ